MAKNRRTILTLDEIPRGGGLTQYCLAHRYPEIYETADTFVAAYRAGWVERDHVEALAVLVKKGLQRNESLKTTVRPARGKATADRRRWIEANCTDLLDLARNGAQKKLAAQDVLGRLTKSFPKWNPSLRTIERDLDTILYPESNPTSAEQQLVPKAGRQTVQARVI